jgi:hypothetical protein
MSDFELPITESMGCGTPVVKPRYSDSMPIFDPYILTSDDPNLGMIAFKWSWIHFQMQMKAWQNCYWGERDEILEYWMSVCRP